MAGSGRLGALDDEGTMILGLLILLASGLYAWLGGWLVVVAACGVVGILSVIEAWTVSEVAAVLLLVALAVALGTIGYDFWWHTMAGLMRSSGEALAYFKDIILCEGLLMAMIVVKMVKAYNGR